MTKQWVFRRKGTVHSVDLYCYPQSWGIGLGIWGRNIVITLLCLEIEWYWGKEKNR